MLALVAHRDTRLVYAGRHKRTLPREAHEVKTCRKDQPPGIYENLVPRVRIRMVTRPSNVHEQYG